MFLIKKVHGARTARMALTSDIYIKLIFHYIPHQNMQR